MSTNRYFPTLSPMSQKPLFRQLIYITKVGGREKKKQEKSDTKQNSPQYSGTEQVLAQAKDEKLVPTERGTSLVWTCIINETLTRKQSFVWYATEQSWKHPVIFISNYFINFRENVIYHDVYCFKIRFSPYHPVLIAPKTVYDQELPKMVNLNLKTYFNTAGAVWQYSIQLCKKNNIQVPF